MAAVSNAVVHLTMRFGKTILSIGSGFIYQLDNDYFIVTAWHNLTGRHPETLKALDEKHSAIPNNIIVNLATSYPDIGVARQSIVIDITDENTSLFYVHEINWPRIDVAVIPLDLEKNYRSEFYTSTGEEFEVVKPLKSSIPNITQFEICPIQNYFVPEEDVIEEWLDSVEVTEELFIPGYPYNIQDYYSQPVWKRATIASSIQLGWNKEPKFLIDCASKSGMSGSPVLYYNPNGSIQISATRHQYAHEIAILAGVYVGRLGVTKDADPQVGTVWKQSVIDEIIQTKCFEKHPNEMQLPNRELLNRMQSILPNYTKEGIEHIKNPASPFRHYACRLLMNEIQGRASPHDALEAVLEAAKNYKGPFAIDNEEQSININ